MKKNIRIEGIDKLEAKLKKNATLNDCRNVVKKNGADLQALMTRNAVFVKGYSTGTTKRSIHSVYSNSNLTVSVGPTTEYAPYVEYGTRFMEAQPFIRPSYNIQKEIFKKDLNKLFK